jgi:hypothetical protein
MDWSYVMLTGGKIKEKALDLMKTIYEKNIHQIDISPLKALMVCVLLMTVQRTMTLLL